MGLFDRARKLAEQAKEKAEQAIAEVRDRSETSSPPPATATAPPGFGTPYRPGMLGRPGWRERGLVDPAALLPIEDRDRAGVPRSTRSQIVEEPYGMGRRWSVGDRSVGLFHQLYPEHRDWEAGPDHDSSLVFLGPADRPVVLEVRGLEDSARDALARAVAGQLAAG